MPGCHTSEMSVSAALCRAKLRDGKPCRSVATDDEFCAYHAALADASGPRSSLTATRRKSGTPDSASP